jgi:hypothetical protein
MRFFILTLALWATEAIAVAPWPEDVLYRELLWVADNAGLDFGNDHGPWLGWVGRGTPLQVQNKFQITRIVLYCSNVERDPTGSPSVARVCEGQQVAAYKRIVNGNASRVLIVNCIMDNYVYIEQCIAAAQAP